jgi:GT2 family glycosyltransferase
MKPVVVEKNPASLSGKESIMLWARKIKRAFTSFCYGIYPPYRKIKNSGLFHHEYYFSQNPDVQTKPFDLIVHYLKYGSVEGRSPNPLFDDAWYGHNYPRVGVSGTNPLYHYISKGWKEGKNPCAMFESGFYLESHPELRQAGINPLAHYFKEGARKGYKPNPFFDSAFYLNEYQDVKDSGENPLVHYMRVGIWEGRQIHEHRDVFARQPRISIITPVYNVPALYLKACIDSVMNQTYGNWELCLVDDASPASHIREVLEEYARRDTRIKVKCLEKNLGIAGATNEAASMATGEYLGLLDNDDELTRDALHEVVKAINQQNADLLYSDECIVNSDGEYLHAHHKPDFSPDLLLSHNYITHFLVFEKTLFDQVGGVSSVFDGAQDYELLLKMTEQAKQIAHIPKICYRWRTLETSTSSNPGAKSYADTAGKRALEQALTRRGIEADVEPGNLPFYYRVHRKLLANPLISILIPFHDQPEYLEKCITAILERSTYGHFEVLGISNNSKQPQTFDQMQALLAKDTRVRFVEYNRPFNFSAINNFGASQSSGEHLVLMNNDIEVISPDWIEALLEHSQRPEVAAVGGKLYYPDLTIQHAGVIVGIGGFAGHSHKYFPKESPGYFNRLFCTQNVSAVTAALLMVKRSCYEEVGGLDEEHLGVALNDVDFCLKLREKGYLNVFTPYAEALHHESLTRGYEDTPEKKTRFRREVDCFKEKWKDLLAAGDPYYNRNLSLRREDFNRKTLSWYESLEERKRILQEQSQVTFGEEL